MTLLSSDRRLVFYDAAGTAYQPVRHGDRASGRSVFKIKPKGGSNRAEDAILTEDWLELARAMLVDELPARCKALTGGMVNYLRYGAEKLQSYELDPALAVALNIPAKGKAGETITVLSRAAIEAAMDAFDRFQQTGEHGEIFTRFGSPRDYWVRSSRARPNRVYPSKPIHAYVIGNVAISGGWASPSYSAAALHNAGFIIVDEGNRPIQPPEGEDHLIRDADRIRLCGLNYYIEPAREQGKTEVSIRAGDLAAAIGLQDALPNICQALGGEKFQRLARVPPPTHTEPNPSSSTIFTYKLQSKAEATHVTEEAVIPANPATNLILYGPPGTGKTYHTAWEAVRLCLGDAEAERFKGDENRVALMAEYGRLMKDKRIEFVTFHQSTSYEDFVEGLRPETGGGALDEQPTGTAQSSGFRLEAKPGIFLRICEAAEGARKAASNPVFEPDRSIFKLAINGDDPEGLNRKALEDGLIFWTRGGDINWEAERFSDFNEIRDRWRQDYPDADGRGADIAGTFYFRKVVEIGDYVVLTWGRDRFIGIGRVSGDYEYQPEPGLPPHRRTVEWLWSDFEDGKDRSGFFEKKFSAWQPIYELTDTQLDRNALNSLLPDAASSRSIARAVPYVLIIDEINRANISKALGDLITLLEPDKRLDMPNELRLVLPYSKRHFGVPGNLHIIGTMNTADRSIALLDTALRRRFTFRELMPDPSVLSKNVDGLDLQTLLTRMNERIEYLFDREHQIGHAYFTGCRSRADVDEVMRHKVIPLLAEYFFEDWAKIAAVLGDLEPHEGAITGGFLKRSILKAPPGLEDREADPRYRWEVRSVGDGFDYGKLVGA